MRLRFLLILLIVLLPALVSAQDVQKLPRDPRIKTGKMANGLTYYLVKNANMNGYADFYLVQKVGSVLESERQKGLTAIIGDMGIRGTRNFPGNTILNYIEELGMETGTDFNIINGFNNSMYKMANVPVGRSPLVVDSTLLILFNWLCSINIDEEDVAKEKVYYKNIFVQRLDADSRTYAQHMRNLFPGTDYVTPVADTMLNMLQGYTSKDIRSYYYQWYRPERHALIVVGDIDTTSMDTQIKTLFQATPRYLDKNKINKKAINLNRRVTASVVSDREKATCDMDIYFRTQSLPAFLRTSAVPFVMDYMNSMMAFLFEDRLSAIAADRSIPLISLSASFGSFMKVEDMEALAFHLSTSPEYADSVLSFATEEIYRVKKFGFTKEEFQRARNRYFENLNYRYDWRIFTPNQVYVDRCMGNYIDGYSLASIELNKEYMDMVWYEIGLEQFNTFVSSYIRNGDNTVITCSYPRNPDVPEISGTRLEQVFTAAMSKPSGPNAYIPVENESITGEIKAGTIISETKEPISNSIMWNLSNGATVVFKKTQQNASKFRFDAVAKGGLSIMNDNSPIVRKYIDEIAAVGKLGSMDASQVERLMKEKEMVLKKEFSLSTTTLTGNAESGDIDDFMKLIYLHFYGYTADNKAYDVLKESIRSRMQYSQYDPKTVFADSLSAILYRKSAYSSNGTAGSIETVDYPSIVKFINKAFSNAANYTFIFVGDLDQNVLKEMTCKYIASLPGNPNMKDTWRVVPFYLNKSDVSAHYEMEMELPRTISNVTVVGPAPFNMEDIVTLKVVSYIIENRVKNGMLEEGILIDSKTSFRKFPEEFMNISFDFVTGDYSEKYTMRLSEILDDIAENGASASEIAMAQASIKDRIAFDERTKNSFWTDVIIDRFIYGKDFYTRQMQYLNTLTSDRVDETLMDYMKKSKRAVLTATGTKAL